MQESLSATGYSLITSLWSKTSISFKKKFTETHHKPTSKWWNFWWSTPTLLMAQKVHFRQKRIHKNPFQTDLQVVGFLANHHVNSRRSKTSIFPKRIQHNPPPSSQIFDGPLCESTHQASPL